MSTTLGTLSRVLDRDHFAIITCSEQRGMYNDNISSCFVIPQLFNILFSFCSATGEGLTQEKKHIHGIVFNIHLLYYLLQKTQTTD